MGVLKGDIFGQSSAKRYKNLRPEKVSGVLGAFSLFPSTPKSWLRICMMEKSGEKWGAITDGGGKNATKKEKKESTQINGQSVSIYDANVLSQIDQLSPNVAVI